MFPFYVNTNERTSVILHACEFLMGKIKLVFAVRAWSFVVHVASLSTTLVFGSTL